MLFLLKEEIALYAQDIAFLIRLMAKIPFPEKENSVLELNTC